MEKKKTERWFVIIDGQLCVSFNNPASAFKRQEQYLALGFTKDIIIAKEVKGEV
jgi:hypothetical protein